MRIENGVSVRKTLERLASGPFPNELALAQLNAEPDMPAYCEGMWALFLEMHFRRAVAEYGPVRFAWADIQAYMGVTGRRLDPWQLDTLFALEDAYFAVEAEHKK